MKRLVDYYLRKWMVNPRRRPLILKGARQVGKTHAVRALASSFTDFVEINFDQIPKARIFFEEDLKPARILREISLLIKKDIIPGKTLLFFDEVQEAPKAILSLRYFYEEMPDLHIIAAGSLLDFALENVGVPVGRVEFLYMYPMSFIEFLVATGNHLILTEILAHEPQEKLSSTIHAMCLRLVAEYLALGGMPAVIDCWIESPTALECTITQTAILDAYRQDFGKYAKKHQITHVSTLFDEVPRQLGKKFKYSDIEGEYRKRELQPALNLLITAGIIHRVYASAAQGIPIGAQADFQVFKTLFLDVGLAQSILGLDLSSWFLDTSAEFINKGAIVESFVGQELLAYGSPLQKRDLYYWQRNAPSSTAEIDYLIQKKDRIIPVEVKGGEGSTLKSMHAFLNSHPESPYGLRFSTQNYSILEKIVSYPLYAIAKVATEGQEELRKAIEALMP